MACERMPLLFVQTGWGGVAPVFKNRIPSLLYHVWRFWFLIFSIAAKCIPTTVSKHEPANNLFYCFHLRANKTFTFRATLRVMNTHLYEELEHLSIAEKRSLGEALIVSAESEASAPLITEAQHSELRSRLAYHRANPGEQGVTFSQLKTKLLSTSR